uniref:DNA-directed RNA polymerase subunit beta' n=1 Tax=Microthamnion kuetzingianum TaxID=34148 RepID=A0A097KNG5_9CHLO|nr:beta' subunit of RNA polymerase [Microthamnion kuetzingianum]AIT94718.1 beta' subunit of RNA polymerase [Microthamnion kuetzingianum]
MKSDKPAVESLEIGLASPETIRQWAEKVLPNGKIFGEVTSPQTVNYKSLKPVKKGLFCERIFGPVEDFVCSCGKKPEQNQRYCNDCDVEYTSSKVRRYRLGYIELGSPVAHVWYFKGRVNYISTLLGMRRRRIDAFLYGTRITHSIDSLDFLTRFLRKLPRKKFLFYEYNPFFVLPLIFPFSWHCEQDGKRFVDFFTKLPESEDFPLPEYFPYALNKYKKKKSQNFLDIKDLSSLTKFKKRKTSSRFGISSKARNNPRIRKNRPFSFVSNLNTEKKIGLEEIRAKREFRNNNILAKRNQKEIFPRTLPYTKEQTVRDQLPCIGAQPFRQVLTNLDFPMLDLILSKKLYRLNVELAIWVNKELPMPLDGEIESYTKLKRRRLILLQRIKLVKNFIRTKQKPEWIILSALPVLPPGLRPILQLSGDQVAISDLNKLYQKILFRNRRFSQKSLDNPLYTQRLLQEGVDALIENGKGGAEPVCASNGRPLKSLSDMLKGKKGRFRQNLLGKRVDYSGRSVIVVGPQLQIHECGLPKEMAIELFQPFLVRQLVIHGLVTTILAAKKLIAEQSAIIWEVLEQLLEDHLVLLNRAPTLHRLGIQAFQPKLVNGRAILLHPLVCTGFNADFDGDQMAVHIPLSYQARAEAWQLMWSRNNILSPATGQPILVPSQDMVLGCYYLTTENSRNQRGTNLYFSELKETLLAYAKNKLDIHAFIWVRCDRNFETGNKNNNPLEIRIDSYGNSLEFYDNAQYFLDYEGNQVSQQVRTTLGRIIFNEILQDCFKLV